MCTAVVGQSQITCIVNLLQIEDKYHNMNHALHLTETNNINGIFKFLASLKIYIGGLKCNLTMGNLAQ
jgi:hypothetical protein